ncbi:AmmeMemoRadiSam system protein B [bacterium]|nr:AmmeMemoRadiSam system protein B [bacterium]
MNELPHYLTYPVLREPLELRREELEGKLYFVLRCPLGLTQQPLVLQAVVAPILQHFTGEHSLHAIAEKLSSLGASEEIVLQVARLLDDSLFLQGPPFEKAFHHMKLSFRRASVRPSALAGSAFSHTESALHHEIQGYLDLGEHLRASMKSSSLRALMTPHIDYHRGKECYGRIYQALRESPPERILLIGTSHQYSPHLFHFTEKDFETPLGIMKNDREIVRALAERYGTERAYADELLHRQEHSLELQLPFLQELAPHAQIIPILVGSFHRFVEEGRSPDQDERYLSFVEGCAEVLSRENSCKEGKLLILAGVDMAHIGRFFGDAREVTEPWLREIHERDQHYLELLKRQERSLLFEHIAEDRDARRICGFPTMYTVLHLFEKLGWKNRNELVDYRQAVNAANGCVVTFAGMTFDALEETR